MKSLCLILCLSLAMGLSAAMAQKTTRPIRPGDISKATEVFLVEGQRDEFLKTVLLPVFRAAETSMTRQLPEAGDIAAELAQALDRLFENPNKELPYIAARAFLSRPDLFHPSFEALSAGERPRAIAKVFSGWLDLKADLEKNPQLPSATKVRISALKNIIDTWRDRYPQNLPAAWRKDR